MAQVIKYQTTTIKGEKSASEIQSLVQKYGGSRCEIRWDGKGQVIGVRFALPHERIGEVPISLTASTDRIFDILQANRRTGTWQKEETDQAQAHRIAWRQLKDFVEQALLAVKTGLFPVHAAFMHAIETGDADEDGNPVTLGTYFEEHAMIENGHLSLNSGQIIEAEYELEAE